MVYQKTKTLTSVKSNAIKHFNKYYLTHIEFLRSNFSYLVDYKTQVGQLHPIFKMVQQDLFDEDPFVVYGASLIATLAFADQNLYH